jgi:outer membrane protein assembly factor BamB
LPGKLETPRDAAYHFSRPMTVIQLHPRASLRLLTEAPAAPPRRTPTIPGDVPSPASGGLRALLYGPASATHELPPLTDLLGALLALADGQRRKALLPLSGLPAELAIVRRGQSALVSFYHTDASPEVLVLDRRIPLRGLVDAAAAALESELPDESDPRARAIAIRLVARAATGELVPDEDSGLSATRRTGGAVDDPGERHPLAFGFEAAIFPSADPAREPVSHADVHAMLFSGQLWAWVRGRRIPLSRGPIVLVAQRMISAVRALADAAEEGRALHVRLRSGPFVIAVRREKTGDVALTLGSDDDGIVTVPALDDRRAGLPILRLASDLLRALVSVDRSQARNLRIRALRDEVRRLRRAIATVPPSGFVNGDPDRLRAVHPEGSSSPGSVPSIGGAQLRFGKRWSVALDGLDAPSTFLCGDRLVVATERRVVAIDRDSGEILWQHETPAAAAFLAGTNIVRVRTDGVVEMREVHTGEVVIRTKLAPRTGGAPLGLYAGSASIPPTAIVCEGRDRLAAIDLRTGELRWRFANRGAGAFRMRREGRVLLAVGGDSTVHAIDVVTGEVCWRFVGQGRFCLTPIVIGDTALVLAGEPGRGDATLVGLDLFTGALRFETPLGAPAAAAPIAVGTRALVATTGPRRGGLSLISVEDGSTVFSVADPGFGAGGGVLALDRTLLVNAPDGKLSALDLSTGAVRWTSTLASSVEGDVPRRLTPILRNGAVFVPQSTIHVVRPADGRPIGAPLPCDLVPDAMIVDERGWVFVGEESGHLVALAPEARLVLLKS